MQNLITKSLSLALISGVCLSGALSAQVLNPDYNQGTTQDAITGPNQFSSGETEHWFVDEGADNYFIEQYERPMNQSFSYYGETYATNSDYFGNLDIESGSVGITDGFLYARMKMWSTELEGADGSVDDDGLIYFYRLRLGELLLSSEQPVDKGTSWTLEKNFIYKDINGDRLTDGNGYEVKVASDGKTDDDAKDAVLYTRIDPNDETAVEFAFNFALFGWEASQVLDALDDMIFEANKGHMDPQNYWFNQEYTANEAGSPNGGLNDLSEFGTQGLGNIYELDTMRFTPIPEPATVVLMLLPGGFLAWLHRRNVRRKKAAAAAAASQLEA